MLTGTHNESFGHEISGAPDQLSSQLLSNGMTEEHGVAVTELVDLVNHSLLYSLVVVA
jgi:hypothetical protein